MYLKNKDNLFFIISIFLYLVISILSIYSASMYLSPSLGNLPLKQLVWYLVGLGLVLAVAKINNKYLYKYAWFVYLGSIVMLVSLFFFAPSINGSKSWFIIGSFGTFQPSEFVKIALVLVNSVIMCKFLDKKRVETKDEIKTLLSVTIVFLIPAVLTFLQPDTGIVIIYFITTIVMLFVSEIRKRWFIGASLVVLVLVGVFLYSYFYQQEFFINVFGSNFFYRMDRVMHWQTGTGMQLNNSLAAIGSSGISGHGFNKTPLYFPEAGTDFIFTVFASNFGFVGSLFILLFLLYFDIKIIKIGKSCVKLRDKYVIAGICGILIYQQVQNIGMTLGILPITGITLPLISYGGSSLLSYLIMIGIIINIDMANQNKKSYN